VQRRNDIIAVIGLILGATLGIGGTLVSTDSLRQILWMIDGVGVVVATSLLAVRFFRGGDDIAAAGFIVFALGESLLVSGNAAGLAASVPSFGGHAEGARDAARTGRERRRRGQQGSVDSEGVGRHLRRGEQPVGQHLDVEKGARTDSGGPALHRDVAAAGLSVRRGGQTGRD
jgi:hypothetical protein